MLDEDYQIDLMDQEYTQNYASKLKSVLMIYEMLMPELNLSLSTTKVNQTNR